MPGNPAEAFPGGHYNIEVDTESRVVYRGGAAGGGANAYGRWFSFEPSTSRAEIRIELAVKPDWLDPVTGELKSSSPIESLYALEAPPGTPMYVGPTSNQGGIYVGGRTQVFIPEPWNFKVISETPLP
jgi:filamentous hemagglutinin